MAGEITAKKTINLNSLDLERDERSSSSILRKTISEPQTGIEPAAFWWPVGRSNHWVTKTPMVS